VTKQRYFSNFEKCLSIFGHRLECTKPESSRLENIGVVVLLYLAAPCCRGLDIFQLGTAIRTPILWSQFWSIRPLRVSGSMVDPVET